MPSLDKIKKRIRSVSTISKITSAMKLIAITKMKKLKNSFTDAHLFSSSFYDLISNLQLEDVMPKKNDSNAPTLWVVVSSSLGMCGGYNSNIIRKAIAEMKPEDHAILIGKKARNNIKQLISSENILSITEYNDIGIIYSLFTPLTKMLIKYYQDGKYKEIKIVYSKYINALTFTAETLNLLPFDFQVFKENNKSKFTNLDEQKREIIFDPSKEVVAKQAIESLVNTVIYAAVCESKLCENVSRRNAMEAATKNAEDLVDSLILSYNETRQQNITQEISEIVSGGE